MRSSIAINANGHPRGRASMRWFASMRVVILAVVGLLAHADRLHSAWLPNGTPVSGLPSVAPPHIVPDGAGGAFIAFGSDPSGGVAAGRNQAGFWQIRIQRLTAEGSVAPNWPSDGLAVSSAEVTPWSTILAADGLGGVFVASEEVVDQSTFHLYTDTYVQRVTPMGTIAPGWPANGTRVRTGRVTTPRSMAPDGSGGVYVVGDDYVYDCRKRAGCNAPEPHVYATHLNAYGGIEVGWPVVLSSQSFRQGFVVSDPTASSVWVAWKEAREVGPALYVTRLNVDGSPAPGWTLEGKPVFVSASSHADYSFASDGMGGVFVTWVDDRNAGLGFDVYAQHLSSDGSMLWPLSGAEVCTGIAFDQRIPRIASDGGGGGAYIVWQDLRSGDEWKVFAQHLASDGLAAPGWSQDGIPLASTPGAQHGHSIAADGLGGAIVAWLDRRDPNGQVHAQRITAGGIPAPGWPGDGLALTATTHPKEGTVLASVSPGEAVVIWPEQRGAFPTVFAQRTVVDGVVAAWISIVSAAVYGGRAMIRWRAPLLAGSLLQIERTEDGYAWAGLGQVEVDRAGDLSFVDESVVTHRLYGYRASWQNHGHEFRSSTAWVTIHRTDELEISVHPNPAKRIPNLTVHLTGQPALLRIVDVAGRVVFSREVGSLGAGSHLLASSGLPSVPAGIYSIRLECAGRFHTRRIVVVH